MRAWSSAMYGAPLGGCSTCSQGRSPRGPGVVAGVGARRVASETSTAPGYVTAETRTMTSPTTTRRITTRGTSTQPRRRSLRGRLARRQAPRSRPRRRAAHRATRVCGAATAWRRRWRTGRGFRTTARADRAPGPWSPRGLSPELAATQQHVKDRADAPQKRDQDPQELPQAGQVLAVDDVDHAEDKGERMQKEREQDLDDELHRSGVLIAGQPPEGA